MLNLLWLYCIYFSFSFLFLFLATVFWRWNKVIYKSSFTTAAVRCGMCRTNQIHGIQWQCSRWTCCGVLRHRAECCVASAAYCMTPRRTAAHRTRCERALTRRPGPAITSCQNVHGRMLTRRFLNLFTGRLALTNFIGFTFIHASLWNTCSPDATG